MELSADLNRRMVEAARDFRRQPTHSENLLWQRIRGGKLGVRFRRQQPIGPFVVDFFCPAADLIVEIDGPIHRNTVDRDAECQALLEACGYRVVRILADAVESNLDDVIRNIERMLAS